MGTQAYRGTSGSSYVLLTDQVMIQTPPLQKDGSDDTSLASTSEVDVSPPFDKITDAKIDVYLTEAQATTLSTDWANGTILYAKIAWPVTGTESTPPQLTFQYSKEFDFGKAEKKSVDKAIASNVWRRHTTPVYTGGS